MRDLETMEAAITAAETGHLVFATLHTTGAARTVDRIVDAFPTDQQEQVRTQLRRHRGGHLAGAAAAADKPGPGGGLRDHDLHALHPALIRDNKTYRITSDIQTGAKYGMVTLDAT
jgi:twitching motility protein PilT